jgi:hypothetical protein
VFCSLFGHLQLSLERAFRESRSNALSTFCFLHNKSASLSCKDLPLSFA